MRYDRQRFANLISLASLEDDPDRLNEINKEILRHLYQKLKELNDRLEVRIGILIPRKEALN